MDVDLLDHHRHNGSADHERDSGGGAVTREPAWFILFAHVLRTAATRLHGAFPRTVSRLK